MSNKVLPRNARKLNALFENFEVVPVETIFSVLYPDKPMPATRRLIAMQIGSALTRYRRITGRKLMPAMEKYTYTILED